MQVKKRVLPDENSWLVKYIVKYANSLRLDDKDNTSLWEALEQFTTSFSTECEYLHDNKEPVKLYPVISYNRDKHLVVLENLELVSDQVLQLKIGNFLSNKTKVKPVPKEKVEKKQSFWTRLKNLFKRKNQNLSVEVIEDNKHDLDKSGELLANINDVNVYEAKELLLKVSYDRKFNRKQFISRLERDQEMGLEKLKVKFDVSYLYECGFLKSESFEGFKKLLGNNRVVELEFTIKDEDYGNILESLKESQLIKVQDTNLQPAAAA